LGAGVRPEILPLEKVLETSKLSGFPSVIQREFADIIEKNHWRHVPRKLIHFWKSNSGGLFSLYSACIVRANSSGECSFRGVVPKNWPRFEDLIGLESNKRKLIKNTESFIHRGQAAHVLLWGGRGTGKSSSVLALLGEYIDQGLRLIEIRSDELFLIPELTRILDSRPEKFLLFCDDLSFGKDNPDYRYLKSIMEGSVFTPASNLLFIATTNRKDLVLRGKLDERQPEQKQLIDEKRAIDDRFGLKLFYEVPTFKQLLNILYFYADKTGLSYDRKELGEEFHRFARLNNHDQPSGRTARQFIREWKRERSMSESR
jgi:predicted AAA+ superfamily ATPase